MPIGLLCWMALGPERRRKWLQMWTQDWISHGKIFEERVRKISKSTFYLSFLCSSCSFNRESGHNWDNSVYSFVHPFVSERYPNMIFNVISYSRGTCDSCLLQKVLAKVHGVHTKGWHIDQQQVCAFGLVNSNPLDYGQFLKSVISWYLKHRKCGTKVLSLKLLVENWNRAFLQQAGYSHARKWMNHLHSTNNLLWGYRIS